MLSLKIISQVDEENIFEEANILYKQKTVHYRLIVTFHNFITTSRDNRNDDKGFKLKSQRIIFHEEGKIIQA